MIYMREYSLNAVKRNGSNFRWPSRDPLVEICGRGRVLVENHCGILTYGTEEIRINGRLGAICISGHELEIVKICREKLVVSGVIDSVVYQGR